MLSNLPISITERSFIKKYAEGVDPTIGEPYEIVEVEPITLTGKAAVDRLIQLGYTEDQILKMKEAKDNATN